MSQTPSTMSSAFATAPVNPNVRPAAQISAPPEAEYPTPAAVEQPAAEVPSSPPVVTPAAAPQAAPPQTDWAAMAARQYGEWEERRRQLEAQNAALQQRLQEQDAAINNLLHIQQDYDELRKQQQINDAVQGIDYSDLATVDAEDARRISEGVMRAVQAKLAPVEQQLARQQQEIQKTAAYNEQRIMEQQARATVGKIENSHPDFGVLLHDPMFKTFLRQRDGRSSITLEDRAAAEFRLGNADYVIHLIDQFKQTRPDPSSLVAVAPVQTAASPVAPAGPAESLPTLAELNSMMGTGRITPDEYREYMKRLRAAQKQ